MTDEPNLTESNEPHSSGLEDPRFEVKWKKKSGSSAATPPSAESAGAEADAPATPTETADAAELRSELERERARNKELHERWQRAAADLANLRRRTEGEREEVEKFAALRLVQELLPVLDNFERALATIPGNLAMLTWIQGVMLIQRHLEALLEQRGLEPIEAEGQHFNPYFHEAVNEREQEGVEPGTVVAVYQKGYSVHGRVIRPSLVEIAKAPAEPASAPEPEAPAEPASAPEPEAPAEPLATEPDDGAEIAAETEVENPGP